MCTVEVEIEVSKLLKNWLSWVIKISLSLAELLTGKVILKSNFRRKSVYDFYINKGLGDISIASKK